MEGRGRWKFAKMVMVTIITVIIMVLVTIIGVMRCWCSSAQLQRAMSHIWQQQQKEGILSQNLLLHEKLPCSCTCDAALLPANTRTCGFPKGGGNGTQFEKGKKETQPPVKFLIWWKGKPFNCAAPEKINTKLEFCTLQGVHSKGGKVQMLKRIMI